MSNSQMKLEIREYEKKIKEINKELDDDRYMQDIVAGSLIGRKYAYMEFIEKIKEWCE